MVLLWAAEVISWSLAPYDTTPLDLRPPLGSWQRAASDFFQAPPGRALVVALVVGLSIILCAIALRSISDSPALRARLMLGFALSNVVIGGAIPLSGFVVADLPLELAPYPGYGWTLKFLVPEVALLTLLFGVQAWVVPRRVARQTLA
jgi:hypothetical protein